VGIDPSVLGPLAAFVFAILAIVVKVFWDFVRRYIGRLEASEKFWQELALRSIGHADKAIDLADRKLSDGP
jgi:hypothetical protein